ncbi:MAG: type IX secretion system sortase PorU [Bacteroidota bacterium]
MTKQIFFITAFCLTMLSAQNESSTSDVKVLESNERGITFELRPQYFASKNVSGSGAAYDLPQFKNSIPASSNTAGKEDIRVRVLSLAFPSYRGNTVTVTASDAETINSFSLAPVPSVESVDQLGTAQYRYTPNFTSPQEFLPKSIVQISDIGLVKGILTGNVVISPYQYQSSTKTLKRYSRIVVRVDYGTKEVTSDLSGSMDWAKATLLNFPIVKQWGSTVRMQKTTAVNSVLSTGTWVKLEVTEDGMYKISANYLRAAGIDPSSLNSIQDVKIFGANGRNIAENIAAVRPADLPQVAVEYVDKNSNTKFDADDYLLFYGQGVNSWSYDAAGKNFSNYVNPYSFSNYYFISTGSSSPVRTIPTVSIAQASGGKLSQTLGKVFFDEEKFNFLYSGQQWFSPPMNANESRVISNKLTGWIPGTSVTYRFSFYSRSNTLSQFIVEESGSPLTSAFVSGMTEGDLGSSTANYAEASGFIQTTVIPNLTDERSNLKVTYSVSSSIAAGFIDRVNIFYRQRLTAFSDLLTFAAPDTSGVVEFAASGFTTNSVNVYEVSDVNNVRKLSVAPDQILGSFSAKDTLQKGNIRRYWAGSESKYLTPKSFFKIPNSNLHAVNGAEFLIITHSDFKSEAVRLKNHKESLPGAKKISTIVVDVDTVYNEFGAGISDPTAIRDFIRYAVKNWTVPPKYVLFFGDASFDYRSILQSGRSFVPTYESYESNDKISTLSNEDYFAYIDENAPYRVAIAHGRLTPRTPEEARIVVDKIIKYETTVPKGTWKSLVTIVADDKWTPERDDEEEHTFQAEGLASTYTPKNFEIRRIYLEEFATVYTSSGRRKPDARTAMLDQVNSGTLILNFTGHGNPKVWAHESILTLDDVRNQFLNYDRLPFIVAATCDWGRFEEAGETSSAEEVMFNRNGGAIGVLSATRAVWSASNAETNRYFYANLFSGKTMMRLGDACLNTKNVLGDLENKQKYFLMGDPTMRLAMPDGVITIDSLKSSTASVDTLRALEKITVKASVRDSSNAVDQSFNGTALLTVFDADKSKVIPSIPGMTYDENGAIIYKGECTVTNGVMRAEFIVPKDIAYENKNGRISIYFSNAATDGKGYTRNFIVGGSSVSAQKDSVGPRIDIYFDNEQFRPGDVVSEHPTLIVSLVDSSGINSSTNSIGHRLEAWIDGSAKSVDLTEYYKGKTDSY